MATYLLVVDDEGSARVTAMDDPADARDAGRPGAMAQLGDRDPMPLGLALLTIARSEPGWLDRAIPHS